MRGLGDGSTGGDFVAAIREDLVWCDAGQANGDDGGDAKAFLNDGGEVGELFEIGDLDVLVGFASGHDGGEFVAEALEHGGVGEEVVGDDGEELGDCFAAGDDDDFGFVDEALRFLFRLWELAVEDFGEDGCLAGGLAFFDV